MASNGCGLFGGVSWLCHKLTGVEPPYAPCCDEHDLAYEQIESEADRAWADALFRRCLEERGYPRLARVFYYTIRLGGWVTWLNPWSGR